MKKGRLYRWGFLVCLVLVAACLLASCTKNEEPARQSETEQSSAEPLVLEKSDGSFKYTIIREDIVRDKAFVEAAVLLRTSILKYTGLKDTQVLISTDWSMDDLTSPAITQAYEILLGNTNREESAQALAQLQDGEYLIQVANEYKIVIIGYDAAATSKAVRVFLDRFFPMGEGETGAKGLSSVRIPEDLYIKGTFTQEDREQYEKESWAAYVANLPRVSSKAQLIQTKYETKDWVIADINAADFGVDPTGEKDSTRGIQQALNACATLNGGTVWLPEGRYLVTGTIHVPAFVTLRGEWQNPDLVTDGRSYGTVIVYKGNALGSDDEAKEQGLFLLGGSAGAVGLTVYYPDQSLDDIKIYPHTFYVPGGMLSTVADVTILNAYRGIGACLGETGHEQLTLENIYGTFLHTGLDIANSSDVGTVTTMKADGSYWANCKLGAVPSQTEIEAYTRAHATGMRLGDLEWTEFSNIRLSQFQYGVKTVKGVRATFAGSFYDLYVTDCDYGIEIEDMDDRWGMVIGRSVVQGSEYAIRNMTRAYIKSTDVDYKGDIYGLHIGEYLDQESLQDRVVPYDRTYVKPEPNLYVAELLKSEEADSSLLLQEVLDEAGKTGGIVYVPAGIYRFEHPVTVPAGVELRGAGSVPNRCQSGVSLGTMFYVYYGAGMGFDPNEDQAFLTLSGENAGVSGIRFFMPQNNIMVVDSLDTLRSVYMIRGTAKGVYCVNCGISAAGYGVDFRGCDNHYIKKLVAWCYYNVITAGGKDGMIFGNLSNATVMLRTNSVISKWDNFSLGYNVGFQLSRKHLDYLVLQDAENEVLCSTFTYGCKTLVTVMNSRNVLMVNIGSDNIGDTAYQLMFENSDAVAVSVMRYNGYSFLQEGGHVSLYSRTAIWEPDEVTYTS